MNERWGSLEAPLLEAIGTDAIEWASPLIDDTYAEYRDDSFLARIGQAGLAEELKAFWPARGPQWDALGVTSSGDVLLIEAKEHIAEMCSPGTAAGPASRARIEQALDEVALRFGARADRAAWSMHFYQLANRIAHLDFLRWRGVRAWLVLVNFLGDTDVHGPATEEAWDAAYAVAFHVMGLRRAHPLNRYILHVYPPVQA